jgi:hypothetical protein
MAQKVTVVLTCDLHDAEMPAITTVGFGYQGQSYEFDLCQDHLDEFTQVMRRFAGSARRSGRGGRKAPAATEDLAAIREWARANGHQVSDRGRIAASIREAYEAATR